MPRKRRYNKDARITIMQGRLAQLMRAARLNPTSLADVAGMAPTSVETMIKGKVADPGISSILFLADALGVTVGSLFEEGA